jgi:uncharacterized membrane protein YfcA
VLVLTVLLAAAVGALLGLLGGGGSVLAVPLLVFVAGLSPHEAAATSLFVVALTSTVGLLPHARANRVRWRAGAIFGTAGMLGAYLGATLAGRVPGGVLLGVFAVLMLATAVAMIRGRRPDRAGEQPPAGARVRTIGLGFLVGMLTGFVGAGGGFVIVPALVLLSGLPMAEAVGTSLFIVAMQSTSGLVGHLAGTPIDWKLAIGVATASVIGATLGGRLTGRIDQGRLRQGFGWFVLMMGSLVVLAQFPAPFAARGTLAVLIGSASALSGVAMLRRHRRESAPSPPPTGVVAVPSSVSTPRAMARASDR